jgi:hypothetical protein
MKYETTLNVQDHDQIVLVKWISCGQPRPYADSIYEAELIFTGKNSSTRPSATPPFVCGCHPLEKDVLALARVLVHEWNDGSSKHGLSPYLDFCRKVEEVPGVGRWRVRVVVPFCD